MTIDGRFVARAFMFLAGCAFVYAGVSAYRSDRYTPDEVVISVVAFVIAVIAALWLWRHPSQGGRS